MYALKVLDKRQLASRSRRWQLHCSRELQCLKECNHPYIVQLAYSFQTPQYLYMVQEYLPNHTMAQYLDNHDGRPVREDEIRFIVAELVLALAHMHKMEIVYRDLKPANVLIDDNGHMRVVDMGMASHLDPETKKRKSVCGTQVGGATGVAGVAGAAGAAGVARVAGVAGVGVACVACVARVTCVAARVTSGDGGWRTTDGAACVRRDIWRPR